MLKYYLDLMFHLSDNYNCNPYLLVHNYTTNAQQTHVMTHMLAEKICSCIENLEDGPYDQNNEEEINGTDDTV